MTEKQRRDAVVALAERVMGWRTRLVTRTAGTPNPRIVADVTLGDGNTTHFHLTGTGAMLSRWEPFDSIADAMMIVEALRRKKFYCELSGYTADREGNQWRAMFGTACHCGGGCYDRDADAPTLPEAICLAALEAAQ